MDKFIIEGGNRLVGEVAISGSKNSTLPILAATLMANGPCVLNNVPQLADVHAKIALLKHLGATVKQEKDTFIIDPSSVDKDEAPYEIVRKMRTSFMVLGPLLTRFKKARVSLPGGCAIGARPVDLHIKGLVALGAHIELHEGYVEASLPQGRLKGTSITLEFPSVGATEHIMTVACCAEGTTVIENAAIEPEILELAQVLTRMGAHIRGAGTKTVVIEGREQLNTFNYTVGPDRIESGTFIAAAAITAGDVLLRNVRAADLSQVMAKFSEIGCSFEQHALGDDGFFDIKVRGAQRLKARDMQTAPYPGFPTDMQAQFMACMTVAEGASCIHETIFENRFMHAQELLRMGADISIHDGNAIVKGVATLSGAPVMATDIRASAGLVLAALRAEGVTEILRIYHLDRGYASLEQKLEALGAKIKRVKE